MSYVYTYKFLVLSFYLNQNSYLGYKGSENLSELEIEFLTIQNWRDFPAEAGTCCTRSGLVCVSFRSSVSESSFGLHPFLCPFRSTVLVCVHESCFGLRPNWLWPFFYPAFGVRFLSIHTCPIDYAWSFLYIGS